MINLCGQCGAYIVEKEIVESGDYAVCPRCGIKRKFLRMPLFIVTGASGAGKTAACGLLQQMTRQAAVLEGDILWDDRFNTPDNNYREYRELWLRVCKNISQCGKPVVLCGSATPEQFECCAERRYFSVIHYLAVVCGEETLQKRLRNGRGVTDENWIHSSLEFNRWLKENAQKTAPQIHLVDNSRLSKEETAGKILRWLNAELNQ